MSKEAGNLSSHSSSSSLPLGVESREDTSLPSSLFLVPRSLHMRQQAPAAVGVEAV